MISGGLNLTVTGTGLDDATLEVKIGPEVCSILEQNLTTIICRTPLVVSTVRYLY